MTKLYLVRHGETVDNAAQIMQGQTPGKLNAKGIEQAGEVARKMVNEPIDAFVSSDLYRSIQTCEIIARPHIEALSLTGNLTDEELDAHIVTTPLLRERDWGDFTGKFIPSLPKDPKDWPDNIETLFFLRPIAMIISEEFINQFMNIILFKQPGINRRGTDVLDIFFQFFVCFFTNQT